MAVPPLHLLISIELTGCYNKAFYSVAEQKHKFSPGIRTMKIEFDTDEKLAKFELALITQIQASKRDIKKISGWTDKKTNHFVEALVRRIKQNFSNRFNVEALGKQVEAVCNELS